MKRVCHVFFDEYPKDSRIRRYTNTLLESGFEVLIISLNNGNLKKYEEHERLKIFRINLKKKRGKFSRRILEYFLFELTAFYYVTKVYLKYKPQIFHVHTLPDFLVLSTLIPKISGVKIILDFHELFPEAILQFKKGLKKSSFYYKAILLQEKISYNFANYIIVFHDPAKEIINSRYGDKKNAVVIMNGVDETEVSDFRKKKSDNFKIVYNGTINYNLNLSLLIKALIYIKKHHSDVYQKIFFYLYGDGPDLDNILNLARDNQIERVKYCGRLEFKKMIKELETASLCILPPSKDVYSDLFYSLKLIEMIYLKIPVIASKLNTYQIYYPEGCLLYFEPDNETDLAEKILFAYNNPDKLKEYADCAYKQYQKYSWNIMKKRYTDLIQNILCNSQGNRKVVRNCN